MQHDCQSAQIQKDTSNKVALMQTQIQLLSKPSKTDEHKRHFYSNLMQNLTSCHLTEQLGSHLQLVACRMDSTSDPGPTTA